MNETVDVNPVEIWKELIAQGKVSEEVLCAAAKLKPEQLERYFAGEMAFGADRCFLNDLAVQLGCGLHGIDDNVRIQAILDCLIENYKMTEQMIANLLSVDAELVRKMRSCQEVVWQTRYHFAVKLYYIFYALRYPDYEKAGEA